MEVDIALKEQEALKLAKSKLLSDANNSSSFDASDQAHQTGNSFYKRKQSHDGNGVAYG